MLTQATFKSLAERQPASYWARVRETALALKTDGCSGPASILQAYIHGCYEHDIHYRTGITLSGLLISKEQADKLLAIRSRQMAWDSISWSPASWLHVLGLTLGSIRYVGLSIGGASSWKGEKEPVPQPCYQWPRFTESA